jgi:hypothetical protein
MPFAFSVSGKSRRTRSIRRGMSPFHRSTAELTSCRYVEMLEQQQTQLVAGMRELYSRLQRGHGWPGQPLPEASGGYPLTHDILERLDLLHPSHDNSSHYEGFEEDCDRMQHRLLERGAPFNQRRGSASSDSEHGHASSTSSYEGTPVTASFPFETPFARTHAPPTPPMDSSVQTQSQLVSPMKQESPMVQSLTFVAPGSLDPMELLRTAWMNDSIAMDESVDFTKPMYGFDSVGYDQNMTIDTMALDPMMPDWNSTSDLDFSNFIQNPIGA